MPTVNRARHQELKSGFTLLEIMLAVAVLGLVGITIHRFVEGTLNAVRQSTELVAEERSLTALGDFLRYQLQHLPIRPGAISGEPHRFNEVSGDEIRWVATAGSGLMTRFAGGEYNVALTTRQRTDGDGFELGLNRHDFEARQEANWLPLMPKIHALEIRYYDARTQSWVERWSDQTTRPSIVRMQLWRVADEEPFEMNIPVPYISVAAQLPQFNFNRNRNRRRRNRGGGDQNTQERRRQHANDANRDHPAGDRTQRRAPGERPPGGGPPPR